MALITTHHEIQIRQAEVPGAPFEWIHEEADAHGMAPTLEDAMRQIDAHLAASPCRNCKQSEVA